MKNRFGETKRSRGAGVNLRIHVIGFDVTPEETQQLTCVADKGKGKYLATADAGRLVTALAEVEKEVVAPTPAPEPQKPANEASFGDHFDRNELARISRAPCKGTVFQRVRTPPGNFRSSR